MCLHIGRLAGSQVNNSKGDNGDTKKGGDYSQEALEYIVKQGLIFFSRCVFLQPLGYVPLDKIIADTCGRLLDPLKT